MNKAVIALCLSAAGALAQEYRLVRSWGERGEGPGQFLGAHGIVVTRDRVIVVDSRSSRVWRFTTEGKFLDEIGAGPGSGPGQFAAPRDAAVSPDDRIFVADGSNNRIQVFSAEGRYLKSLGSKGSDPDQFLRAHALDFGASGRLFVADVDNSRIAVYDAKGRFLTTWGKAGSHPGEFHAPHGLGVLADGHIVVGNYYGPVQVFTPEGKLVREFGHMKAENNLASYHSLAVDRAGRIFLSTRDKQRRSTILCYSSAGEIIARWPMPRPEDLIEDVAVDNAGRVFVTYQGRQATGVHVFAQR